MLIILLFVFFLEHADQTKQQLRITKNSYSFNSILTYILAPEQELSTNSSILQVSYGKAPIHQGGIFMIFKVWMTI